MLAAYEEQLGDGLVLRTVRDEHDVERYVALSRAVVSETEGGLAERVLRHRPGQTWDDFVLVEDTRTGEVVSTTCLMPWRVRYEDVVLDTAMLEMVVTHRDYRRRGLVRRQMRRFHQMVDERGFDLSIIQGIPYYYRQYGYAYALDHQPVDALPARRIPDPPEQASAYRLRAATIDDVPLLAGLLRDASAGYRVCVLRDEGYWQYLLQHTQHPARVVENHATGERVGFVTVFNRGDGLLEVTESALASHDAAVAVLRLLKAESAAEIRLVGSEAAALIRAARSFGSAPAPTYQWLLRIVDLRRFLAKIGPVLERRLAVSDCAGLTADVCINLYREACVLRFDSGRLVEVASPGFVDASLGADGGDLCIPPEAFVRLVFGYRSLDELCDAWPDIVVRPSRRRVLDVLFPRLASLVSMPY